jgi:hypothetical protein
VTLKELTIAQKRIPISWPRLWLPPPFVGISKKTRRNSKKKRGIPERRHHAFFTLRITTPDDPAGSVYHSNSLGSMRIFSTEQNTDAGPSPAFFQHRPSAYVRIRAETSSPAIDQQDACPDHREELCFGPNKYEA